MCRESIGFCPPPSQIPRTLGRTKGLYLRMLMKDDEGGMGGQANDDGPRQYLQVATHKRLINLSELISD